MLEKDRYIVARAGHLPSQVFQRESFHLTERQDPTFVPSSLRVLNVKTKSKFLRKQDHWVRFREEFSARLY